jgi:hypothetical protein
MCYQMFTLIAERVQGKISSCKLYNLLCHFSSQTWTCSDALDYEVIDQIQGLVAPYICRHCNKGVKAHGDKVEDVSFDMLMHTRVIKALLAAETIPSSLLASIWNSRHLLKWCYWKEMMI